MRIVVTGVPGVGKTTVIESVIKESGYELVNYGTVMLQIAKYYGVKSRDEIRKLDLETQRTVQKQAGIEISKKKNAVVDTHMSIRTKNGFLPGLPDWVLKTLKPDLLVLVEAEPENILKHRNYDESRTRDPDTIEDIKMQQEINRMFAASCSVLSGANVGIVQNEEGNVDSAVKKLMEMIKNG